MEVPGREPPDIAELSGGAGGQRPPWLPGFYVSLIVWFGFIFVPLALFFVAPMLVAYLVAPWTSWAYPFLMLPSAGGLGILLTLAQILIISVIFGGVTQQRSRGDQVLIAIAVFVVIMVIMKFVGPHLGLEMPRVRM